MEFTRVIHQVDSFAARAAEITSSDRHSSLSEGSRRQRTTDGRARRRSTTLTTWKEAHYDQLPVSTTDDQPDGRSRDKRQSLLGGDRRAGAERWPSMRRRRPYQDESDAAFRRLICYRLVRCRTGSDRVDHTGRTRHASSHLSRGFGDFMSYYLVKFYCSFDLDIPTFDIAFRDQRFATHIELHGTATRRYLSGSDSHIEFRRH